MTSVNDFHEAWLEAERIAKYVHLNKVGEGQYVAQLNRDRCICDRCSVERKGVSPAAALWEVIGALKGRPLHDTSDSSKGAK